MNDIFKQAGQPNTTTRASLLKLNQPLWGTNHGHKNTSYIGPIIWINLPNFLKTTDNLNTYKHTIKEHFFPLLKKRQTIYIYLSYIWFLFNEQPIFIFIFLITFFLLL